MTERLAFQVGVRGGSCALPRYWSRSLSWWIYVKRGPWPCAISDVGPTLRLSASASDGTVEHRKLNPCEPDKFPGMGTGSAGRSGLIETHTPKAHPRLTSCRLVDS